MITPNQIPDPARPLDERERETVAACERAIDLRIGTAGHRDQWPAVVTLDDPGRRVRDNVLRMYRLAGWEVTERAKPEPESDAWIVVIGFIDEEES